MKYQRIFIRIQGNLQGDLSEIIREFSASAKTNHGLEVDLLTEADMMDLLKKKCIVSRTPK